MSAPLERVKAEALDLSPEERAHLAHELIESLDDLDDEAEVSPAEWERAWEEEIQRRLDEYRSGAVQPIPSSEIFAWARAQLK